MFRDKRETKNNLLHLSARCNAIKVSQHLIDVCNIDVNSVNYQDSTPLHFACIEGHAEIVKLLIDSNAKVKVGNRHNQTPLHLAAVHGSLSIVKQLVDKGASTYAVSKRGYSPLEMAAVKGNFDVVKFLFDLNVVSQGQYMSFENTDVHDKEFAMFNWACRQKYMAIVISFLNEFGVNKIFKNKYSPLHYAVVTADQKLVEFLIGNKADVNSSGPKSVTPLHLSTKNREVTELLINANADINMKDDDNRTPIDLAPPRFRENIIKLYNKKHGAAIKMKPKKKGSR